MRNDVDILVLPIKYLDEIRNYTREELSGIEALASVSANTSHFVGQPSLTSLYRMSLGVILG